MKHLLVPGTTVMFKRRDEQKETWFLSGGLLVHLEGSWGRDAV